MVQHSQAATPLGQQTSAVAAANKPHVSGRFLGAVPRHERSEVLRSIILKYLKAEVSSWRAYRVAEHSRHAGGL